MLIGLILSLIYLLFPLTSIRHENPKLFCVEGWKSGEQQIQERKLILSLKDNQTNFGVYINDISGVPRYKLVARPSRFSERVRFEAWLISLYKEPDPLVQLDKYPNYNLLSSERPEPGKHYFPDPDEANISLLYPSENPKTWQRDLVGLYPMSAKRVVKVEAFYCVIQVLEYKFNAANPRRLESLIVQVEFTNKYESCRENAA